MSLFVSQKAIRRVEERLAKLIDQHDEQQRAIRTLKLEWEETYDKIHRLFGRIAKRTAIDTPPLTPPPPPENPAEPEIDEISAAIHARRAAGKH